MLVRLSASGHGRRCGVEEFWASVSWERRVVGGNEVERMRGCGLVEKEAEGREEFNHPSGDCIQKIMCDN